MRDYKVVRLSDEHIESWNELVSESHDAWFYHLYNFHSLQSQYLGCTDFSFVVIDRNGKLVAGFPLVVTNVAGSRNIVNKGFFSGYLDAQGPFTRNEFQGKTRERLMHLLISHAENLCLESHGDYFFIGLPTLAINNLKQASGPMINPLIRFGFDDRSIGTFIIDLRHTEQKLFNDISERYRSSIRKALSLGIKIQRSSNRHDLSNYYKMLEATLHRKYAKPPPLELFDRIFTIFSPLNRLDLLLATSGNEVLAGIIVIRYKEGAEYWSMACTENGLESHAVKLLFWKAILHAKESGCSWFECGEAWYKKERTQLYGLTQFKERFGGQLFYYFRADKKLQLGRND